MGSVEDKEDIPVSAVIVWIVKMQSPSAAFACCKRVLYHQSIANASENAYRTYLPPWNWRVPVVFSDGIHLTVGL